jgi:glutamate-1-semialdehyde 2,1-aminomutase
MDYATRTPRSERLGERLRRSLPGGDTRSITYFAPYPVVIERGSGYEMADADGNTYIDLLNNYTALVHGHAHPAIVRAIVDHAPLGTVFPAPHEAQAALAEEIVRRIPSVERVRFTNSGSEAVMQAVRVARAYTGREVIVKADGGYHGSWEQVPMAASDPAPAGTPREVAGLVRFVPYNDVDALGSLMRQEGDKVAAILLEPVLGEGVIAGDPEYFRAARELATRYAALLVLDEVVTARLAVGGYQSVLGVEPDLTTFGKIIGGGLPVGAVGGRADVMAGFDPRRPHAVTHSGTFNGNPLTTAAGLVSLTLLTEAEIDRINHLGGVLAAGLRDAIREAGLPGWVTDCGSLLHLHFESRGDVRTFADVNLESQVLAQVHLACMEEGLFIAPRGLLNTSTAFTEAAVEEAVARFARVLGRMAGAPAGGGAREPASDLASRR